MMIPAPFLPEQVWARFTQGDPAAFNQIYRYYAPILQRYGATITPDPCLVEDEVQNLFVYLYAKRSCLREVENLHAYLKRCLLRLLMRALKQAGNRNLRHEQYAEGLPTYAPTQEEAWISREKSQMMRQHLGILRASLSPCQAHYLHLKFEEGLSYEEISAFTQRGYQTVVNQVNRGIQRMRDEAISCAAVGLPDQEPPAQSAAGS
jgi:RNA polymerase sigma factor (sigma-70 family)